MRVNDWMCGVCCYVNPGSTFLCGGCGRSSDTPTPIATPPHPEVPEPQEVTGDDEGMIVELARKLFAFEYGTGPVTWESAQDYTRTKFLDRAHSIQQWFLTELARNQPQPQEVTGDTLEEVHGSDNGAQVITSWLEGGSTVIALPRNYVNPLVPAEYQDWLVGQMIMVDGISYLVICRNYGIYYAATHPIGNATPLVIAKKPPRKTSPWANVSDATLARFGLGRKQGAIPPTPCDQYRDNTLDVKSSGKGVSVEGEHLFGAIASYFIAGVIPSRLVLESYLLRVEARLNALEEEKKC